MSNFPANHPFWNILRLLVVGALLLGFLALNYSRLDPRDATTILGVLAGLAGYDKLMPKGGNEGGT